MRSRSSLSRIARLFSPLKKFWSESLNFLWGGRNFVIPAYAGTQFFVIPSQSKIRRAAERESRFLVLPSREKPG